MKNTNKIITTLNNNHFVFEDYRQRVTRKEAQYILVEYPHIFFHGHLRHMRAKSVGAGIYEIYKEKEEK
jgi:hypothetical protein